MSGIQLDLVCDNVFVVNLHCPKHVDAATDGFACLRCDLPTLNLSNLLHCLAVAGALTRAFSVGYDSYGNGMCGWPAWVSNTRGEEAPMTEESP